jgi:3-oxoacyl-[acyl-carrier-protein] synthase-3
MDAGRVALFLMHYLDPRVARRAADRAGLPPTRVIATAEAAGHVAAGGIPIALTDARAAGRVGPGDVVCCAAFGAGMSWGAVLLRL